MYGILQHPTEEPIKVDRFPVVPAPWTVRITAGTFTTLYLSLSEAKGLAKDLEEVIATILADTLALEAPAVEPPK